MRDVFTRQITLSRRALAGLAALALAIATVAWFLSDPTDDIKKEVEGNASVVRMHKPVPVPLNRKLEVADGFRGAVHPILHGQTRLAVTAYWTAPEKSQLKLEAPEAVYSWYTRLKPVVPQTTYTQRDFAAFLPASVSDVGQIWALDPDKVLVFLRQFHESPSLHLVATGRRAGPDGAFAILRAVSPSHLDIVFRIHAEFYVTPSDADPQQPIFAWYTPAYFSGRLVVNKTTGTVEHFRLALPSEKATNVFLTVNPSLLGIPKLGHDIVRVERMELSGGAGGLVDTIAWAKSLTSVETSRRLARIFYTFEEIDWTPPEKVMPQARAQNRPIFAIVSWGATDDQSC